MTIEGYDVAQICENGHVVNSSAHNFPAHNKIRCDKCGSRTIMSCTNCKAQILGKYHVPGVFGFSQYNAPAYCHRCGSPFPWTSIHINATREAISELEELTESERELLSKSLDDLVRETPRAKLAESRFKRILRKVGAGSYEEIKSLVKEIISESIRKSLFGE